MGLTDQAIIDTATITSNQNDWGVLITLLAPTGETATIAGIHSKHHLGVDTEGNMINTKKAHVSFSESVLLAFNPYYPVRNYRNEVNLSKHKISVKDSTGKSCNYIMQSWFPDEKIGLITCILEDFK